MAENVWNSGLGIEALGLFINYLFDTFPLRKLYGEVPGFNLESFVSARGRIFREEGRQRDHEWMFGRYWDLVIVAVWRDDWEVSGQPLVRRLARGSRPGSQNPR